MNLILNTGLLMSLEIRERNKIGEVKYWPLGQLPANMAPYTTQYLQDL